MSTHLLPEDTLTALKEVGTPSNFGLAFLTYLAPPGTDLRNWKKTGTEEETWKKLVEQSREIFILKDEDEGSTQSALDQQHVRYDRILNLRRRRWVKEAAYCIDADVAWRLLIGLSAPSVLNNSLTLHPLFGFPYLPSTGVKGLASSFRLTEIAAQVGVYPLRALGDIEKRRAREEPTPWQQLDDLLLTPEPETAKGEKDLADAFERLREDEDLPEGSDLKSGACTLADVRALSTSYRRAFGGPDSGRGAVEFFDALPRALIVEGKSLLERDVLTPHYGDYYTDDEGEVQPADYHDPVPVQMLAVRRGVRFAFRMTCQDTGLLSEVRGWLERAVSDWGAGAKTHSGYGELIVS